MVSTNTKLAEALRLAREWFRHEEAGEGPQAYDVIKAADEAIAAYDAEQEPCHDAWRAALAQRREPLTDAEIEEILHGEIALNPGEGCAGRFARAIERAHGIGATTGEQR